MINMGLIDIPGHHVPQLTHLNVECKLLEKDAMAKQRDLVPGGGGELPYMGYTGMCRWTGYGFWPLCPEQGIQFYANLS